jgi:hypothetical protein
MGVFGLINHLLNFAWPALALAVALPLLVRWTPLGRGATSRVTLQMLVVAMVNLAVLLAGLLWFGRDGKMATYLVMAAASASSLWLLHKNWRA